MVQAPHSPSPQAYLVPVRPIRSRNISSALISGGTLTLRSTPFSLNLMSMVADMDQHPLQDVVDKLAPIPVGRTHIADWVNFFRGRRDGGCDGVVVERFAFDGSLGLRRPDRRRRHRAEGDADVLQSLC